MWLIPKTFKLSGISLIHVFYLILIITPAYALSITSVEDEYNPDNKQPEGKNNDVDKDAQEKTKSVQSNVDNSIAEEEEKTPEPANNFAGLSGIIKKLSQKSSNSPQPTNIRDELSETNLETENKKYGADEKVDIKEIDKEPDNSNENPFGTMTIGINSSEEKKKETEDANDNNYNELKSAEEIPTGDTKDDTEKMEKSSKSVKSDELKIDDVGASKKDGSTRDDAELEVSVMSEPGEKLTEDMRKMTSTENGYGDNEELNELAKTNEKISTSDTQDDTEKIENPSKAVTSGELESNPGVEMETKIISDNMKNPTEDLLTDKDIDPSELTISSLEKVEIVKIKSDVLNSTVEAKRKEKKKMLFQAFKPTGDARIYCTFLGDVLKMYNKVKKRFEGHLCHAVVIGSPIFLKKNKVHLSSNIKNQMKRVQPHLQDSFLIVIMQCLNYNDWSLALDNSNQLVKNIVNMVIEYDIDGIQFSNLQPTGQDQIDIHMIDKIVDFIQSLVTAAAKKKRDLKIGITINSYSQSITTSFTSFTKLNPLVTWYSFQTISMLRCTPEFKSGTSPLKGEVSLETSIETLTSTEIDTLKVVVGIQLYPNRINEVQPFTYEELCSAPKNTWNKWCAAEPDDLRLKGLYLRKMAIGGVQLFYMHSDDYRSKCGCYSFPLIRALLRGLVKTIEPESCVLAEAYN